MPDKTKHADTHATRVATAIIEQLRAGTAPWQKPWTESHDPVAPVNGATGRPYRGGNCVYLWSEQNAHGYADNRWMTYKQAVAMGAQVRRGEHGTAIEYWQREMREAVKDAAGKPLKGPDGHQQYRDVKLQRPRVFHATVFNAAQIDGLPPREAKPVQNEWQRQERAEGILRESGAVIHHGGDRAFYSPVTDSITLPARDQFDASDKYYATALHELGHWTGHPSRLDRDLSGGFGSELYAREELRAEISSLMVGDRLGIGHDPGQHVAYVQSWIKALENDPREIFRAAADAERISDYVMQFDHELAHEAAHDQVPIKEHEPTPEESARWHKDEWRIDPALHASADPVMGTLGGQLWQEERAEPEAVAEPAAVQHAEPDEDMEEDDGMEM